MEIYGQTAATRGHDEMNTGPYISRFAAQRLEYLAMYAAAGVEVEEWTFTSYDGIVWVFADCNDLGIPYFHVAGRAVLFTVRAAADKLYWEVQK